MRDCEIKSFHRMSFPKDKAYPEHSSVEAASARMSLRVLLNNRVGFPSHLSLVIVLRLSGGLHVTERARHPWDPWQRHVGGEQETLRGAGRVP